jgi:hypothetical protein
MLLLSKKNGVPVGTRLSIQLRARLQFVNQAARWYYLVWWCFGVQILVRVLHTDVREAVEAPGAADLLKLCFLVVISLRKCVVLIAKARVCRVSLALSAFEGPRSELG